MSPLMSSVLSQAEYVEVDVTYKAAVEFEYLLNMVTFDYHSLRCIYICIFNVRFIIFNLFCNYRDSCCSCSTQPAKC